MGVHKCADHANGDDHLAPFERRLWSLTYSCLYKFGCPVIFQTFGPNAPKKIDLRITFFVPFANENSHLVIDYLHQELDDEVREGQTLDCGDHEEYLYGTSVSIVEFSGTDFYLERHEVAVMTHSLVKSFMQKLDKKSAN